MAQWDCWCLWSSGGQVQYPALYSGLRIQHRCSCGIGYNCGSDLIPGPGTAYTEGWPKEKKKKSIRNLFFHSCGGQRSNISFTGQNQGVSRATLSSETLGGNLLSLPVSGGCQHSLACGHITSISASVVTLPSPFRFVKSAPPPLSF